jgi:radical SAM superfamily enzyme YgiQ (UPF0313 family)
VDFLLEVELDVAEFTIMTPFPHSPLRTRIAAENRLLDSDWGEYTADRVVFRPRRMSPEKLQEMYHYAWDTFYAGGGYQIKMAELFAKVIRREM